MSYARVFQSGNSQAVRLPKEFRLNVEQVEIFRRGNEIAKSQNHKIHKIQNHKIQNQKSNQRGQSRLISCFPHPKLH